MGVVAGGALLAEVAGGLVAEGGVLGSQALLHGARPCRWRGTRWHPAMTSDTTRRTARSVSLQAICLTTR